MKDSKYIVLRTRDVKWKGETQEVPWATVTQSQIVTDAVVIRKKDPFAGPALHAYAASISVTVSLLKQSDDPELQEHARRLLSIADYFHEAANDADLMEHKLPD